VTTFTTEDRIIAEQNGSLTTNIEPNTTVITTGLAEQGTDAWKIEKLGHVSAGSVSDILAKGRGGESKMRDAYKWRIITERLTGLVQDSFSNDAMAWGVETEAEARMTYEMIYGVTVDQTGFVKHPTLQWVGASPDGMINGDGLIEIKCPHTKTHLQTIKSGEAPKVYYSQMQMQMWTMNRQWCDFVSYDPRLPHNLQFFCKRVERDKEFIADMEKEVLQFLAEVESELEALKKKEGY
jgi:putative phage-type endonuclease